MTKPHRFGRSATILLWAAACIGVGTLNACNLANVRHEPTAAMVHTTPAYVPILIDGDISDWPADLTALADEHYLYMRFTFEGEQFTLQAANRTTAVYLDIDANSATGQQIRVEGVRDPLGADMVLEFSPRDAGGKLGRGVRLSALDAAGGKTRLSTKDFDVVFAPTFASSWYELRVSRTPDNLRGLPTAGMFSTGKARGMITTLAPDGTIDAYTDPFTASFHVTCSGGKRESGLDIRPKARGDIRVMSYNVERSAPLKNAAPFKDIIEAVKPDVILFQEWDQGAPGSLRSWLTANIPGQNWNVIAPEGDLSKGGGVAIATPFPLTQVGSPLSVNLENRSAPVRYVAGAVESPQGTFLVASTHLKSGGGKNTSEDTRRMAEARAINAAMRSAIAQHPKAVRLIGGDYNLVGSRPPLDILRAGLDVDGSDLSVVDAQVWGDNSFYTWADEATPFSPGRLDFIVYSDENADITHSFVLDTQRLSEEALAMSGLRKDTTDASDHLPVVVDFRVRR